jgi:hypothetical protein
LARDKILLEETKEITKLVGREKDINILISSPKNKHSYKQQFMLVVAVFNLFSEEWLINCAAMKLQE